jgi:hypothetical protein
MFLSIPEMPRSGCLVFLQAVKEPVARKAIGHLKSNAPEWLARVTVRQGPPLRQRFWQPGGGYDRNITSTEAPGFLPFRSGGV